MTVHLYSSLSLSVTARELNIAISLLYDKNPDLNKIKIIVPSAIPLPPHLRIKMQALLKVNRLVTKSSCSSSRPTQIVIKIVGVNSDGREEERFRGWVGCSCFSSSHGGIFRASPADGDRTLSQGGCPRKSRFQR